MFIILNMILKKHFLKYLAVLVLVPTFVGFGYSFINSSPEESEASVSEVSEVEKPKEEVFPYTLAPRSSLYLALRELDISPGTIQQVVEAAKPFTNLAQLKPGTRFQVVYKDESQKELSQIKFRFSAVEKVEVINGSQGWVAKKVEVRVDSKIVTFRGLVKTTLWESAIAAQMDPNLTAELAEIFAWQVDFSREVQVGDRWRLSVEQKLVKGKPYGWGRILAAEYENVGELYSAVLFRNGEEELGYFAPDGSSLKRMFLKSPIKFGRISSRFNRKRFHPILKVNRPHLGVDYAAPSGTPIRAVGDGRVTIAAWRGGGGKTVMISHNSVYKTAYKHLSGFAKGIKSGSRVKQGQIIGYVGSTGMSTGPHLHFEFYRHGAYVDPLGQKFPSADPVPSELISQFNTATPVALASLPEWEKGDLTLRAPSSEDDDAARAESGTL